VAREDAVTVRRHEDASRLARDGDVADTLERRAVERHDRAFVAARDVEPLLVGRSSDGERIGADVHALGLFEVARRVRFEQRELAAPAQGREHATIAHHEQLLGAPRERGHVDDGARLDVDRDDGVLRAVRHERDRPRTAPREGDRRRTLAWSARRRERRVFGAGDRRVERRRRRRCARRCIAHLEPRRRRTRASGCERSRERDPRNAM